MNDFASFGQQVETLLALDYPALAGLTTDQFLARLEPLRRLAPRRGSSRGKTPSDSPIPFVIVIQPALVSPALAIQRVFLDDKPGLTDMTADDLAIFRPLATVPVPDGPAYLLADIDTGRATLNVTPNDALPIIQNQKRTPLTLAEGVALVTHYPQLLKTHNAFSMLGSRCGDRRVTALWLSRGVPRLGWCWAANPHTWLGSASAARRIAP